jgi:hypothetical protein
MLKQHFAFGGGLDALGRAYQQRLPQLLFQLLDRHADRRLGDVQLLCGGGHVTAFDHRVKNLICVQHCHHSFLYLV